MAVSFKNIKSTVLDMTDTIRVGKLQGCRICDVIPDHYEYLIWADKSGLMKYTGIVTETIKEHAGFKNQQRHQLEEVDPYTKEYDEPSVQEVNFSDDDIPF